MSRFDEFDSGDYNDICRAYLEKAMRNCDVDEKKRDEILGEFKWLLDTVSSKEIME